MAESRNIKNEFLVCMHTLENEMRPVLKSFGLREDLDNIATIVLAKILQFADKFEGDSFYDTLTGTILMDYFKTFTEGELEILQEEQGKSPFRLLFQQIFSVGTIPSYLDDCTFIEYTDFAGISEVFSSVLSDYMRLHPDMTKEECGCVLSIVYDEVITLDSTECACFVIDSTVGFLLKDKSFKEKIEYQKIIKK